VWETTLPALQGKPAIPHNSKVKVFFAHAGWGVDGRSQ